MIVKSTFKDLGIVAGAGPSSSQGRNTPVTLMYPRERGSARGDTLVSSAKYQNGYIFSGMNQTDKRYSTLVSSRKLKNREVQMASVSENVCTIMMPMSNADVSVDSHNFNATKMSKVDRAGGDIMGFVSNALSDIVGSITENVTGGYLADNDEQLYQIGRNSYGGANIRSRTFTWDLTPTNARDYQELMMIIRAFRHFSYGRLSKNSATLKEGGDMLSGGFQSAQNMMTDGIGQERQQQVLIPKITDGLSNAMVVSNPTIWYIKKYGTVGSVTDTNLFGPCQIENITVDAAPDGQFNGLAIAPGLSTSYRISITFRELITLTQDSL